MNKALKKLSGGESPDRASGATILKSLSEDEWIDLLNRLKLFVAGHYYGPLDRDDLPMEAITEVLENRRTWNPDFPPFQNLCWIIRSIAANQLEKERRIVPLYPHARGADSTPTSNPAPAYPSPAEDFEASETHRRISDLLQQAAGGNNLFSRIISLALKKDRWKPKEIADELKVSEPEVYNARRRIRRKLRKLLGISEGGDVL
ncbi:MAG TPA: hypothetical protein VGC87_26360 [Pyrinomonadaceae bacterium]